MLDLAVRLEALDADERQLELRVAPHEEQDLVRDVEGECEGEAGERRVDLVAGGDEDVAREGDDDGRQEREAHREPTLRRDTKGQ